MPARYLTVQPQALFDQLAPWMWSCISKRAHVSFQSQMNTHCHERGMPCANNCLSLKLKCVFKLLHLYLGERCESCHLPCCCGNAPTLPLQGNTPLSGQTRASHPGSSTAPSKPLWESCSVWIAKGILAVSVIVKEKNCNCTNSAYFFFFLQTNT